MFYFSINGGAFLSSIITPKLRADVECFGRLDCFPLAFGLPALLMGVAILIFFLGRGRYTHHNAKQNVLVDYAVTVWLGLRGLCSRLLAKKERGQSGQTGHGDAEVGEVDVAPPMHWLDPAIGQFGVRFVEDVKIANAVLYLFIPLPIFWTLFDQSGSRSIMLKADICAILFLLGSMMSALIPSIVLTNSQTFKTWRTDAIIHVGITAPARCTELTCSGVRWTLQAGQMRTFDMGALGRFQPDIMQSINAALILILIPLFQRVIYPTVRRCGIPCLPINRMVNQ